MLMKGNQTKAKIEIKVEWRNRTGWQGKYKFDGFGRVSSYITNLQGNLETCTLGEHDAFIHHRKSLNKMEEGWSPLSTNEKKCVSVIEKENWKSDQWKVINTFTQLLKYNTLVTWKLTWKGERLGNPKRIQSIRKGNKSYSNCRINRVWISEKSCYIHELNAEETNAETSNIPRKNDVIITL
jgi:hypothetical protein